MQVCPAAGLRSEIASRRANNARRAINASSEELGEEMEMIRGRIRSVVPAVALGLAMTALGAGCAVVTPATAPAPGTAAQDPAPHVWDCGMVSAGSPSKYVCNGKVYTSFQLAKIRLDENKKYESGK